MNKAKESLKENMSEILENLPKEFQEDFKKQLDGMPDAADAPISDDAQIAAIKAELVANPSVDESAAADELKEVKAPVKATLASEAEIKAEMEEALKNAQA